MFILPDLPYPPDALEPYIDKETLLIHHDKHHAAYVKNLNDLLPGKPDSELTGILTHLDAVPDAIRTKVRNNAGGVLNHTLYWQWMTPQKSAPSASFQKIINQDFGNMDTFKEKFLGAGLNHFGSGWAWLIIDHGLLSVITTPNQDSPVTNNQHPVLGVDVWEHAYYLKYQNRRKDYLDAWWNVVNWPEVERLLTA
jgi:superoxide dismutase, Fe-Mn family